MKVDTGPSTPESPSGSFAALPGVTYPGWLSNGVFWHPRLVGPSRTQPLRTRTVHFGATAMTFESPTLKRNEAMPDGTTKPKRIVSSFW